MASKSLGVLTLDLVAKIGGFTAGMDKAARIADTRMRQIEKRAEQFGRALGAGIKAAAGVAAAGMAIYIRNTIEAEKVQAQLAARIKDTAGIAGRSLQQLNAQAEKLQSVTIFDDEAIGSAQAMLLTFKQIQGVNFDAAVEGALDLSTAMGVDLNSAALQLGKALNDPIKGLGALSRAGIQFSKDQRELIKSMVEAGDIAGAQKLILKELEGQMGSAAEAARNTLGGALQGLKNTFNNLLEGDAGGGGVKATTEAINQLSATLNDPAVKQGLDAIAGGVANITAQTIEGISALARFAQNLSNISSLSAKVAAGSGPDAFTDRELEIQTANLSRQKSAARKSGDQAEVDRLQTELTKLIRENTKRIRLEAGAAGTINADRSNVGDLFRGKVYGTGEAVPFVATPTPTGGGSRSGGGGGGRSRGSDALKDQARDAEEARKELERLVEQEAQARDAFESTAASLAGPMAEANFQFIKDQERLNELAKEGAIGTEELRIAQDNLRVAHEKNVEAINAQLTPSQEVVAALQEELLMLGMTNEQQEIYNNLKYAEVDANTAAGQSIVQMTEQLQKAREARAIVDDLKGATKDFFVDLTDDVGTAREAWDDFFDGIKRRAMEFVADKAINALFDMLSGNGGSGSTGVMNPITGGMVSGGGGSSGAGFWASLIGAFMGGGKAGGGTVMPGGLYPVNERGTELLSIGGKDYLMMGSQAGRITPNHQLPTGGRPFTQNLNVTIAGRPDRRTPDQIARAAGREARQQMARTG